MNQVYIQTLLSLPLVGRISHWESKLNLSNISEIVTHWKKKLNFWPDSGKNFFSVTYFSCNHENVSTTLKVRFSFQFIEVSVEEKNPGIYSLLKTALVDIMNTIGKGRYRFSFNIMCPNSKDHFIPFQILDSTVEKCPKCQFQINTKDKKLASRLVWVQSAFQGSQKSILHPYG